MQIIMIRIKVSVYASGVRVEIKFIDRLADTNDSDGRRPRKGLQAVLLQEYCLRGIFTFLAFAAERLVLRNYV